MSPQLIFGKDTGNSNHTASLIQTLKALIYRGFHSLTVLEVFVIAFTAFHCVCFLATQPHAPKDGEGGQKRSTVQLNQDITMLYN